MSWRKAKSPGWAVFDLKQQEKQCPRLEADNEPYPPISTIVAPLHPGQNPVKDKVLTANSLSSVFLPSFNFRTSAVYKDTEKPLQIGNSTANARNKLISATDEAKNVVLACEKLKELHCWADNSLIQDIMAPVNGDIDKASTILEEMVYCDSRGKNKELNVADSECNSVRNLPNSNLVPANKSGFLGETTYLADFNHVPENDFHSPNKELIDDLSVYRTVHPSHGGLQILGNLRFVPIEPEWEKDDVYLIHRKDAMKMMRSASRHSKAASDAFLRGDHASAQHFSFKAREQRKAAEKLNAKAANEILSITNSANDMWKLDLHGLHAAEAVQALQERLRKIETHVIFSRSSSSTKVEVKTGIRRSESLKSLSLLQPEKLNRQRPTSLQVITGKGNHSQGQAALPKAIESFLSENRYHFDASRPGVITVRPKFRY
ncbi:hypothetical protein RJ639_042251 [Escallonia herrerae]|uniref:Smr domain-containing protein n=1 Tax=Escallonia herrerae TaxID=1293975 RepID=A0AA88WJ68_9ASTE|nr:hypothetical protein RJ639_042251 [Escallonia herrerae]